MGSYHSYVGDMKLEDSKDNWYRVSGLNISRFNLGINQRKNLTPGSTRKVDLEIDSDDAPAELAVWGNILSDAWFKATGKNTYFPSQYKNWAIIPQRGRDFRIKDRNIELNMYNIEVSGNYDRNEISKNIYVPSTYPDPDLICYRSVQGVPNTENYFVTGNKPDYTVSKFRPMLTLKPKGGKILEHFTLKIKITRRFTTPNGPSMYRVSFIPEVIEGNPGIIKEAIYKFGIGRNGEDLPDGTYGITNAEAKTRERPLEAGEVVAYESAYGVTHAAGGVGALYKLINGKYLYIKQLHSLPGMEQPWPNNGGIATSIVTFTEADAYTI